ncbi:TniQ family protein [Brevundimonas sp. R86498]|uniref:TniQ family protein n=1 Tax=Brevundimonas sp. R86498 TaxID=3093845 RepID=UPI0037CA8B90
MNGPDLPDRKGRYPAAPEPFPGEAPSAWICRVAHAHDLAAAEILQLQGFTASQFDAGYGEAILHHIAVGAPCRTWPAPHDVVDGLREIGLMPETPPKLSAEDWWTYCPACLSTGGPQRMLRLLALWCQPLALLCLEHAVYLRPWPRDHEVTLASGHTSFEPFADHLLEAEAATDDDLAYGRRLLSPGRADWAPMAHAVFDLTDALMTRTGPQAQGAPLLRDLLGLSASGDHVGSTRLPFAALWGVPATTRLTLLRYLSGLTRPPPLDQEPPAWLRQLARRPGTNLQRSLTGAAADELFLLLTRLNGVAADQLARRASTWPADLRSRMGAAVVIGSLANFA